MQSYAHTLHPSKVPAQKAGFHGVVPTFRQLKKEALVIVPLMQHVRCQPRDMQIANDKHDSLIPYVMLLLFR